MDLQFHDERNNLWEIWTHHNTRRCAYLWQVACVCAGSWSPASWWRPCPGERWRCEVKVAGEPGRRTPPSLCCADSERHHEISLSAALSWSCKEKGKDGHTNLPQKYYTLHKCFMWKTKTSVMKVISQILILYQNAKEHMWLEHPLMVTHLVRYYYPFMLSFNYEYCPLPVQASFKFHQI